VKKVWTILSGYVHPQKMADAQNFQYTGRNSTNPERQQINIVSFKTKEEAIRYPSGATHS
jgi:hypothetical protein